MMELEGLAISPNESRVYLFVKRLMDIVLSLLGLIVLSPLFAVVACLIYMEDAGKIIFCQDRNGKGDHIFRMYKFRSMREDAPLLRAGMEKFNELDGPAFKIKNDPRVTRIGRFIRQTSIDELPQLVNILLGDMSLVGPRPLPTYETKQCTAYQKQRLLVKPGLTCYWQISGRSDVRFDEWIEMDLKYIREMSITTDLKILLQTVRSVITGRGAY